MALLSGRRIVLSLQEEDGTEVVKLAPLYLTDEEWKNQEIVRAAFTYLERSIKQHVN